MTSYTTNQAFYFGMVGNDEVLTSFITSFYYVVYVFIGSITWLYFLPTNEDYATVHFVFFLLPTYFIFYNGSLYVLFFS